MEYKTETRYDGNGQPYDVRLPITSNVISSDNLNPSTNLTFPNLKTEDPNSLLGTTQASTNYVNDLTTQFNTQQDQTNQSRQSVLDLTKALIGKEADVQAANESSGLNDATKQLRDLNAQASALNREAQAIPMKVQQSNQNTGATDAGVAPQTAGALRENAIRAISIAQQADIATANYNAAKDKAQQIIDLKYKPLEAQLEYQKQVYSMNKDILDSVDKKRSEALQITLKKQEDDLQNNKKNQADYAKFALDGGDSKLSSEIMSLNPESPNFRQDLTKLQVQIKQSQLEKAQIANIYSQIEERNRNANGMGDPSTMIAYAQQYASSGSIPVGLPKGTFGNVAKIAKDLPKKDGEIVDNNTNIKSSKITDTQLTALGNMKDLVDKINTAENLFSQLHTGVLGGTVGNVFPSNERQQYDTLRNEIVDLLARARTGAAISANEEKMYLSKIPGTFNQSFFIGTSGKTKLEGLAKSISDKLDSNLKASGVSMYGFSKIKLGNNEYKVGDIIESNGHQGRVNPDGSITPIN